MKTSCPTASGSFPELPKTPAYMKQIAALLPHHHTYVELYDHGPMLLPAKRRSVVEVVNDPHDMVRNAMAGMRENVTPELSNALRSGAHPVCRFHNVQLESKDIVDMLTVYNSDETLFVGAGELCDDVLLLYVIHKIESNFVFYGPFPLAEEFKLPHWKHKVLSAPLEPNGIIDVWIKR